MALPSIDRPIAFIPRRRLSHVWRKKSVTIEIDLERPHAIISTHSNCFRQSSSVLCTISNSYLFLINRVSDHSFLLIPNLRLDMMLIPIARCQWDHKNDICRTVAVYYLKANHNADNLNSGVIVQKDTCANRDWLGMHSNSYPITLLRDRGTSKSQFFGYSHHAVDMSPFSIQWATCNAFFAQFRFLSALNFEVRLTLTRFAYSETWWDKIQIVGPQFGETYGWLQLRCDRNWLSSSLCVCLLL